MGLILSFLVIALTVLVHEYGHYFFMRRNGVKVVEFTIGFGPTLWERQLKSGTMFRLKPILLGGYARPVMEGEGAIDAATPWAKFKIYMAGMFFNATAAFLIFTAIFYATGRAPAVFVEYARMLHPPHALLPLAAAFVGSYGMWLATPIVVAVLAFRGLSQLFSGMMGPVGIIAAGGQLAHASPTPTALALNLLMWFAFINIGLAGFNLLPIFPLDGGRVLDLMLERLGGKYAPILRKAYQLVSIAVFLLFVLTVITGDVLRLVAGAGR